MADASGDDDGPPSSSPTPPSTPSDRPAEEQPPPPADDGRSRDRYPDYPPPSYPPPNPPDAYPPPYPPGSYPPGRSPWDGPAGLPYPGPWTSSQPPSGYPTAGPMLASFGVRVGAWIIDWLVTSAVGAIVLIPMHAVHQVTALNGATSYTVSTQGYALAVLIVVIYGTACIGSRRGQTVGMMALRVKAVDATTGASVTYARALGRALVEYACLVIFVIPWVVDMLFPLWDARRQTLHDKAANTIVIRI